MISRCVFLCYAALIMILGTVDAISPEDKTKLREGIKPYVTKCIQEFGISEEKVMEVEKKGNTDEIDPCVLACIFKKSGIMDGKGLFDVEKSLELTKPFFDNADGVEDIEKIAHTCAKVNDEEVSDGEKGCDRSKLLFKCMLEHQDQ